MAVLALVTLLAALSPLSPYPPAAIDLSNTIAPPSPTHPLGTDEIGRDVLTRVLFGGRISLLVGAVATAISVVIGAMYGSLAGYRGGSVDALLMRLVDFLLAFPAIFVLLILASFRRGSVLTVTLYIGLFGWMSIARLTRGQVLSLRERDFILAARSLGASAWRVVLRHLLPHTLAPLMVAATLGVGDAILIEATLDFLGFGVQPDIATWGNLVAASRQYVATQPWLVVAPGITIALVLISLSLVGDALRDALDPYEPEPRRWSANDGAQADSWV
jgi:peptide/nickel transport system permease protein